jgi:hypothetical protein
MFYGPLAVMELFNGGRVPILMFRLNYGSVWERGSTPVPNKFEIFYFVKI